MDASLVHIFHLKKNKQTKNKTLGAVVVSIWLMSQKATAAQVTEFQLGLRYSKQKNSCNSSAAFRLTLKNGGTKSFLIGNCINKENHNELHGS